MGAVRGSHDSEELSMQSISTIGLDIAKSVFQVHGVDAAGQVVPLQLNRAFRRLVGNAPSAFRQRNGFRS